MKLKILSSSSTSNEYILRSQTGEILLIECGRKLKEVKEYLNFNLSGIIGCLLTHIHLDHSKYMEQYLSAGIPVFTSEGTIDNFKFKGKRRPELCYPKTKFKLGNYTILPFSTIHDAPDPLGFVINHPESGIIVFLTDSFYSPYKFSGVNHFIVESNYCPEILQKNIELGKVSPAIIKRLRTSHMSIDTCIKLLNANDLSFVKNIILIHLSSGNSDAKEFKERVIETTGKKVAIAESGIEINLSINCF